MLINLAVPYAFFAMQHLFFELKFLQIWNPKHLHFYPNNFLRALLMFGIICYQFSADFVLTSPIILLN